jgi:hypothetical protein
MYSPTLGRFLQVDPIGTAGGVNLYAHVNNDPLNLIDLFGLAVDGPQGNGGLIGSISVAGQSANGLVPDSAQGNGGAIVLATIAGGPGSEIDNKQFEMEQQLGEETPEQDIQHGQPINPLSGLPAIPVPVGPPLSSGGGANFYGTPQGQQITAPSGYEGVRALNGQGLVVKPIGQPLGDNRNIIRYGEPSAQNPLGYFRYYNGQGQPIDPTTGKPGPNAATHIPPGYQGPLLNYPGSNQ